ncbi:MAG: oligosaccharide flippase family protein [bacterium]|nr:oligosaccharide flippase family protein [bacterium]
MSDFIRTKFFRHASVLQAGSFVQFGISFAGSVLIARLLGPDQYGVWALAIALAGIMGLSLDWGQLSGLLILFSRASAEGNHERMRDAGSRYIKITLLLYLCVGVPLFFLADILGSALYHREDLGNYVRWLLISGFFTSGFALFAILLQVVRKVWLLTLAENADQGLKTGMMLGGLFAGLGLAGVAGGQALGTALSFLAILFFYRRYVQPTGLVPRVRSMLLHIRETSLRSFLRFSFPMALDNNIVEFYNLGIMLLLGRLASPSEAGFFKISLSYMSLAFFPLGAVTRLLQDQFPKDQVRDPAILRRHFIKVSVVGGFFAMAVGTILVLLGPFLIKVVYGAAYENATPFIKAFWWYTAVIGFGIGLGSLFRTISKVHISITINSVVLLVGWPLSLYLLDMYGALGAVYSFTILKGSATIIAVIVAFWYLKFGDLSAPASHGSK